MFVHSSLMEEQQDCSQFNVNNIFDITSSTWYIIIIQLLVRFFVIIILSISTLQMDLQIERKMLYCLSTYHGLPYNLYIYCPENSKSLRTMM